MYSAINIWGRPSNHHRERRAAIAVCVGISLLAACGGKSDPIIREGAHAGDGTPKASEPPSTIEAPPSGAAQAAAGTQCATIDKTYAPSIDPANFVAKIDNKYFPLVEGATYTYAGEKSSIDVSVLPKTKAILGVTTRGVQTTTRLDGQIAKDVLDWYAQDKTGAVWILGEEGKTRQGANLVPISWEAGKDNAQPGLMMPAEPKADEQWRTKYYPCHDESDAKVLALNATINVKGGSFNDCLQTKESSALDPKLDVEKYYCPKKGLVLVADKATGERTGLSDSEVPDPTAPNPNPFPDAGAFPEFPPIAVPDAGAFPEFPPIPPIDVPPIAPPPEIPPMQMPDAGAPQLPPLPPLPQPMN